VCFAAVELRQAVDQRQRSSATGKFSVPSYILDRVAFTIGAAPPIAQNRQIDRANKRNGVMDPISDSYLVQLAFKRQVRVVGCGSVVVIWNNSPTPSVQTTAFHR
jgi:hypothetical protein